MSSFLTTSDTLLWTGALMREFETFSAYRSVTVHKEPTLLISDSGAMSMAGYDNMPVESYTSVPVYQSFPCQVIVNQPPKETSPNELQAETFGETVQIKVLEDARNFINNGRTLYFTLDDLTFDQIGGEKVQNFLGLKFYIFGLKRTT